MNEGAALQIVGLIARRCGGQWDRATIEQWTQDVATLADARAAEEAADVFSHEHKGGFRPSYGDFHEAYLAVVRRSELGRPALGQGSVGPTMPLSEYLVRLYARVQRGDRSATAEWANWKNRLLRPPVVEGTARAGSWLPGWREARATLIELISLDADPVASAP